MKDMELEEGSEVKNKRKDITGKVSRVDPEVLI